MLTYVLFVSLFVCVILNFIFILILKRKYLKVYIALESPILFDYSIKRAAGILRYLFKREHAVENDKTFSFVCDILLLSFIIFISTIVFSIIT
jgi:hypothetical protein